MPEVLAHGRGDGRLGYLVWHGVEDSGLGALGYGLHGLLHHLLHLQFVLFVHSVDF